ncbi:MAG: biotin--[acetyl-CoA-carboxylase] ligase [Spirochaetaceae bacterium]|jgi:BirA family biotin operon repressor/biotin-[acetyl-CoA-carboxylase] ligase|nr:biotin--[acetyl-CoA-carboxylase] ligase [Spirochaetaceae bacterium]
MMKQLDVRNPFEGPVYYTDSCESTMDEARRLTKEGARSGTVIMAGLQTKGRGRRETRRWVSSAGKNLMFTLILRYPDFSQIPAAMTLRAGIAVANAIEADAPLLSPRLAVKWPNDVMLNGKKCAGIIAESDCSAVLLGIGVNITEDFKDAHIDGAAYRATSVAGELAELDAEVSAAYAKTPLRIQCFLEKALFSLYHTLSSDFDNSWRMELEKRLYMKGETVCFMAGGIPADRGCPPRLVTGVFMGINENGAVRILAEGAENPETFIAGEFVSQ